MLNEVGHVVQTTDYDCGAACCLYILRMLGVDQGQDVRAVMDIVRTLPNKDFLGSTPRNIGSLIQKRCYDNARTVSVRQGPGDSDKGKRFYLSFLAPGRNLFPETGYQQQSKQDQNWTRGPTATAHPNLAILRGVVKVHGSFKEAHWVVQTNFRNGTQVMDPERPKNGGGKWEPPTFQDYMDGWRPSGGGSTLTSMGLDLEITG